MPTKTPSPVSSVVKHEDKMETLRAFIATTLRSGPHNDTREITLLARSATSPVARALVAFGSELVSRNISVRAIFGHLEAEKTAAGWTVSGPEIGFSRDLRWASNPRLGDAHEQLVLGATSCWIGDCLRRDPARRDAYEQFVTGQDQTARTLALSFERLWSASVPLVIRRSSVDASTAPIVAGAIAAQGASVPNGGSPGPAVSSAH